MSKEFLKSLLGDLYTDAIGEKLGDKELAIINDGSYIPRQKFNEKDQEAKELKAQLKTRDQQLEDLKIKAAGNEELTKQLEDLKRTNLETQQEYENRLKEQARDFAIDRAIGDAKARNAKAVRALLDMSKVSLDGENIIGLSDQLEAIKTSDPYLFGDSQPGPVGGGTNPPNTPPKTLDEQIQEAIDKGDIAQSIALKNKKFFGG